MVFAKKNKILCHGCHLMAVRGLIPKLPSYFNYIAENIKLKKINVVINLLTDDFKLITPKGKRTSLKKYEDILKKDFKNFQFNDVHFTVEKAEITSNETIVAYVSQQYVGKNNKKQHIDMTRLIRFVITCVSPNPRPRPRPRPTPKSPWLFGLGIKESDIIKQTLKIDGKYTND